LGHKQAAIIGTKFKWKKDYTEETAKRRLQNIVHPIAELAGLEIVPADGKKKVLCPHTLHAVQLIYRQQSKIWKFPYEKKHDHITITIRDSWRNKHRNSNRPAWEEFKGWAEERGEKVVVLEDQEENPISINDRWDTQETPTTFTSSPSITGCGGTLSTRGRTGISGWFGRKTPLRTSRRRISLLAALTSTKKRKYGRLDRARTKVF
jgi:hypothetical protein